MFCDLAGLFYRVVMNADIFSSLFKTNRQICTIAHHLFRHATVPATGEIAQLLPRHRFLPGGQVPPPQVLRHNVITRTVRSVEVLKPRLDAQLHARAVAVAAVGEIGQLVARLLA